MEAVDESIKTKVELMGKFRAYFICYPNRIETITEQEPFPEKSVRGKKWDFEFLFLILDPIRLL